MSLPRPSGLKPPAAAATPSKLAKPATGIPHKASGLVQPGSLSRTQSAIAKSARAAGLSANVAEKYAANTAHVLSGEEELSVTQPVDDFIIGDRVFVSGSKPGFIAFLGETQFAPGEWAGVVLDETIGKNDGAVSGVRYFQCEPKRGVFCRVSKLSRTPQAGDDSLSMNGDNNTPAKQRPTTPSMLQRPSTPSHGSESRRRPTTPSLPRPVHKSQSSSNTSLNKVAEPSKVKSDTHHVTSTPAASSGARHKLLMGDRVLVSGSKLGTLRYIGPADFAKGEWAGVELDDPLGKNDGAVAGKRYFECRPRYGLFAPVHKVTKVPMGGTVPSPMSRSMPGTGLRLSRERSGSQESVSSVSSATSSASRPRAAGRPGQRPSTLNITATTSALQKALKEKEEHIEQLLRERDLERSEVARAAAQVDETQDQLSHLRVEKERLQEVNEESIAQLKARIQKLAADKHDLEEKLEDERRKNEDLQFQIEEEVISKDDLESRTEEEEAKIRDLEKSLKREKDKTEKYEQELTTIKVKMEHQTNQLAAMEETQTSYLDQVEELTHKLTQAESRLHSQDSSRLEEGAKTSQIGLELAEKTARVSELEDFVSLKNKEVKQLQEKLAEMRDEAKSRQAKFDKLQQTVEELSSKLKANETQTNDLSKEAQNLRSQNADLQRQFESSEERNAQYVNEKMELERQIAEMMKNSGDSSNQLSMLNEQLGQKNRKVEALQADLSTSTQEWHNLNNKFETSMSEKKREIENLTAQHQEEKSSLVSNLEDVQKELAKTKSKIVAIEQDFESEKSALSRRKDGEIAELKHQLEAAAENVSKQEIQTQAHKQLLDKITLEKEAVQFEKEKFEKLVKRLEHEKDVLNNELIQVKVGMSKLQSGQEGWSKQEATLTEQINDLKEERERQDKQNTELQKMKDDIAAEKDKVTGERDQYQREVMEGRASLQQKDMLVEELQKETERLRSETSQQQEMIKQLSDKTTDVGVMQSELAEQRTLVDRLTKRVAEQEAAVKREQERAQEKVDEMGAVKIELEDTQEMVSLLEESVKTAEMERDSLRAQLETALEARQEQGKLLELNKKLNEEIETIQQRHRKEVEMLQSSQAGLQQEVDNATQLVNIRDSEITAKLTQISNLENENSMLNGYKSSNEKLEREKAELHDRINQLQTKLSESQAGNNNVINTKSSVPIELGTNNSHIVDKLKEEHDQATQQVDFLNSVIVELQDKNVELKARLEAMELGVQNGAGDDHMEPLTPSRRMAPRAFCDICDVFDQHETEDCPLQEMSDSPPPTQYHGDRKQVRPYCDICEEFHEPCGGLSVQKVAAKAAAEPLDPVEFVEGWVKEVDTVKSELEAESQKMFGNDQEFFHVHQDPQSNPWFRDSGYYDDSSVSDMRSSLDSKSGLKALDEALRVTEEEKKSIAREIITGSDGSSSSMDSGTKLVHSDGSNCQMKIKRAGSRSSLEREMVKGQIGRGSMEREVAKGQLRRSSVEREVAEGQRSKGSVDREIARDQKGRGSVDREVSKSHIPVGRGSVEKETGKGQLGRSSVEREPVKGDTSRSSVGREIPKPKNYRCSVERENGKDISPRSSTERESKQIKSPRSSVERENEKKNGLHSSVDYIGQNNRTSMDKETVTKQNARSSVEKEVACKKTVENVVQSVSVNTYAAANKSGDGNTDNAEIKLQKADNLDKNPNELKRVSEQVADNRPADLAGVLKAVDEQCEVQTPSSVANDISDESEYQSGRESLASDDSPTVPTTPDMETSVDTGEVFNGEDQVDGNKEGEGQGEGEMDKSCIVS